MADKNNGSYKLLAVDDNDLNLGLFRLFLSQLGHQVTAVNDPFSAVKVATEKPFDLIFTDIQMPGMSGIEASVKFRENGFTGPIIAITAHLSDAEESNILQSAINGVLIKPVTKHDLTQVLAEWLEPSSPASASEVRTEPGKYQVEPIQRQPSATYDLDLALARANGSADLAADMLHMLLESISEAKPAITPEQDPEVLSQTLHKLAGGVKFSGAAKLEAELENVRQQIENPAMDITSLLERILELETWAVAHPKPF